MYSKHIIIPIFVPHKGCPYDCIYCNQKTISGQHDETSEENIKKTIEDHLATSGDNAYVEIGFYGGSFTGIEKELQIKLLKIANHYIKDNLVNAIRLSTRPDYINTEILKYLQYYGVKTIELGVQSLDNEVLTKTCRGHSIDDVITSSHLIKEFGFDLGIQTMIGLPGDDREKALHTAERVIELVPKIVRIYPTLVIRDTYLEKMYNSGLYTPISLDEAVDICSELLNMYKRKSINVIRIGLQATESINLNNDVVAGPFHPAFRQLVESRLILKEIVQCIVKNKLNDKNEITIYTDHRFISNVIGQNKYNIKYLKTKFNFNEVKVRADTNMKSENFLIE
ncbi:MAG: radical SAM protein [Clostridia bacterium]|nr:radical SAM protein [Clostridia bacterium]